MSRRANERGKEWGGGSMAQFVDSIVLDKIANELWRCSALSHADLIDRIGERLSSKLIPLSYCFSLLCFCPPPLPASPFYITTLRTAGSRKRISFISADWINRHLHSVTSGIPRCAELIVLFVSLRGLTQRVYIFRNTNHKNLKFSWDSCNFPRWSLRILFGKLLPVISS